MSNFAGYQSAGFCEVFESQGTPRAHYRALVERLEELSAEDLAGRAELLQAMFRRKVITLSIANGMLQ
jgi:uncharacterized circularly permuted ATP-grasp superfamily protein